MKATLQQIDQSVAHFIKEWGFDILMCLVVFFLLGKIGATFFLFGVMTRRSSDE